MSTLQAFFDARVEYHSKIQVKKNKGQYCSCALCSKDAIIRHNTAISSNCLLFFAICYMFDLYTFALIGEGIQHQIHNTKVM